MGNRLSKIYTRTGDDGSTALGDGTRVAKDDVRVEAYGTVDETNCAIGMILSHPVPDRVRLILVRIQNELFDLGGELCIPGREVLTAEHITQLENEIDEFNETLEPLREFILPSGGHAASACHLARAICRRAERRVITLAREQHVSATGLMYLNRLSDLLFVLCRILGRDAGELELMWQSERIINA